MCVLLCSQGIQFSQVKSVFAKRSCSLPIYILSLTCRLYNSHKFPKYTAAKQRSGIKENKHYCCHSFIHIHELKIIYNLQMLCFFLFFSQGFTKLFSLSPSLFVSPILILCALSLSSFRYKSEKSNNYLHVCMLIAYIWTCISLYMYSV